ncbi:MAG TPA: aminotransferase class I/II-fold pyridoxal phosphate-dependent enzyme [Candidatus Binataceae bacterium]|nr:aminotransferase class I/II-fold pyridoxal phosphate-dependent enzyme [Candidatus Binataceae bacterium]
MARLIKGIESKLIHSGEPDPPIEGAVTTPIFQSSTFETGDAKSYHDLRYIRLSNTPNHEVLHRKLAALENAEAALVTGSGMAAISATLMTTLGARGHLLAQNCLYGGTYDLLTQDFPELGYQLDLIDADEPTSWRELLRENTRAIYVETISNPRLQVSDLHAAVEFARRHELVSIIDNTFASPINFRPAELGFDLSIHSATKYLNGHTDIVAGAVIGRRELVDRIRRKLNHLGGALDPHACFLLSRGMKTLAVRVRYQNESALKIARFLEQHPQVARVNYPGLEAHPNHIRACELFDGFGGVLSFELHGGVDAAEGFIAHISIPISAPSLGGIETLITRPAATSHAGMSAEDRAAAGIADGLIRLSVGLETTDDLIEDFERALRTLG